MPMFIINQPKKIIYLLIMLLFFLFAISAIKINIGMLINDNNKQVIKWSDQVCNIKAAHCNINLDDLSLSLTLNPKVLTYKQPINIEVSLADNNYTEVTAEFIGKTMSMGLFPFKLKLAGFDNKQVKFSGNGSIVFCTIDPSMLWMLQLRIISAHTINQVAIELID